MKASQANFEWTFLPALFHEAVEKNGKEARNLYFHTGFHLETAAQYLLDLDKGLREVFLEAEANNYTLRPLTAREAAMAIPAQNWPAGLPLAREQVEPSQRLGICQRTKNLFRRIIPSRNRN